MGKALCMCERAVSVSSVRSPLPRRGAPGFSIESGVTKCPADLAVRMIQLGATIVHVSEAVNEVEADALARAIELSTTLLRFTAGGTLREHRTARGFVERC